MSNLQKYHFTDKSLKSGVASPYFEFIHTDTLSAGVYSLEAGATDPQKPHTEDELYYVMSGRSSMLIGEETFQVSPGDVIFVPAFLDHHFYDIIEELKLLVFFSKAPIAD